MKNRIFLTLPLLIVVAFLNFRVSSAETGDMVDIELTDLQKQLIREQIATVRTAYPRLNAYIVYESRHGDVILACCDEPNYIDTGSKSDSFNLCYTMSGEHMCKTYHYNSDKMEWEDVATLSRSGGGKLLLTRYTDDFPYGEHGVMYANFSFRSADSGVVFFTQAPLTVGLTSMVATQAAVSVEQLNQVGTVVATIVIGTLLSLMVLPTFIKKSLNSLCR